ncbi:MAG: tetratricopeptide repeat protein [Patescibacteria group bacterium]
MAKESSLIVRVSEIISKYSIYALVFLLPILFLPWTSDMLDFNKQTLLVLFASIAMFSWIAKVLISGKFSANLNKTHIAVLVLFLVSLISTFFSLDKYGSFWGWPSATSGSLLSLIGLTIFYFLISNAFSKKEVITSVILLAVSGLLAGFLGVFQMFGIFLPFNFAKTTSFNTIGLASSLGLFLAVMLPLLIVLEIFTRKWLKIVFGGAIIITLTALVLVNYLTIWWVVLAGMFFILLFAMLKKDIFDLKWIGLPMFFLVLSLFFIILKPQISVPARPIEVFLNQQSGFNIALQTIKDRPILGSGPSTFVLDFLKYKNINFNQSALWNIRFDGAGSKILTVLATTGILGIIAFLALLAAVAYYGIKFMMSKQGKKEDGGFEIAAVGIFVGFIAQTIAYFFLNSNLSLDFLFFFLIAAFICLSSENKKDYTLSSSSFLTLGITFIFTLFLIFGIGLLILDGQRYFAEVNYFNGKTVLASGNLEQGTTKIESAVKANPNSDIYLSELSQVYLLKIGSLINKKDLSDEDKKNIQVLINNSINAAKIVTDVSPNNANNWSVRGFVYQNLIGIVPGAEDWAITSYDSAIKLEPISPYYPTQKGIVYMKKSSLLEEDKASEKNQFLEQAKEQFEKAVQLKSDYSSARFQIAMVYQAQGKTTEELQTLEDAKKSSPNDVGLAFQIGIVYYQQKDYQKAKIELERAVELDPNYANAIYFLGLAYDKLEQKSQAIVQISRVSDLNPDNGYLKKVLDNLRTGKSALDGIEQQAPPEVPVEEAKSETPNK